MERPESSVARVAEQRAEGVVEAQEAAVGIAKATPIGAWSKVLRNRFSILCSSPRAVTRSVKSLIVPM